MMNFELALYGYQALNEGVSEPDIFPPVEVVTVVTRH